MTPDPTEDSESSTPTVTLGDAGATDDDLTTDDEAGESVGPPRQAPPADGLGREGWVLVGLVLFSFLVLPPVLIYLPRAQGLLSSLGLGLQDAYLALPMIPAVLLAVVAVWAAMRSRQR